jgi:F-type H+-transporting ATPase subunit b
VKRIFYLFINVIIPTVAFASEGGKGESPFMGFFWRLIVFVLFVYILVKLLKSPLLGFLDKRTEEIKAAIEDAERARKEADVELKEYKSKLALMSKELDDMKERAFKAAEAERKRIVTDAENTVEKLRQFSDSLIESDLARAKDDLRKYAFDLAKKLAEQKLVSALDTKKHEAIVKYYITKIGELH